MHNLFPSLSGRLLLTTAFCAAFCAPAWAQPGPPVTPGKIGFSIRSVQGSSGLLCSGFQCHPLLQGVTRGERLSLDIRTQMRAPWLLLVGPQPFRTCQTIPGIGNLWAGPANVLLGGVISNPDNIRCWGGVERIPVPVPSGVPLQTIAVFQVVADVQGSVSTPARVPVFSAPVQVTVTR